VHNFGDKEGFGAMDEKGHGDGDENERRKCGSCMRRKEKES